MDVLIQGKQTDILAFERLIKPLSCPILNNNSYTEEGKGYFQLFP